MLLSNGLIHNGADRGGAAPTLRTASEATVDLSGSAWTIRPRVEAGTHLIIGEDVARADNHGDIQVRIAWKANCSRTVSPHESAIGYSVIYRRVRQGFSWHAFAADLYTLSGIAAPSAAAECLTHEIGAS